MFHLFVFYIPYCQTRRNCLLGRTDLESVHIFDNAYMTDAQQRMLTAKLISCFHINYGMRRLKWDEFCSVFGTLRFGFRGIEDVVFQIHSD